MAPYISTSAEGEQSGPDSCNSREYRLAALVILTLAIVVRAVFIFSLHLDKRPLYFAELERVAKNLVTEHVFGNPYALPTGPTAHLAPVYPWVLSLLFWVFGTGQLGTLAVFFFNAVCASAQYALLPILAVCCGLSARVGIVAGVAGALLPFHPLVEISGWEASFVAMCWVSVLALTMYWWRHSAASGWSAGFVGFCWGLLMLAAPQMLSVFAAITILYLWVVPQSTLGRASSAVAAAVLALLPWLVRNEKTFGKLFFVRDNLGLELSMANRDSASLLASIEWRVSNRHPGASPIEALLVQQMGEVNYQHWRLQEASQWIKTHPRTFLWRTLKRIWCFWFTPGLQWHKTPILIPLVLVALVGLIRMFMIMPLAGWLFAACWLMFPAVYYLTFIDARYSYPLYSNVLFLAAFAVVDPRRGWLRARLLSLRQCPS